jgi:phenylpyruvate tautomerase PptA (4-oxalocrotonate tautomerase family)
MTEMMALLRTVLGREVREETYITIREFSHDSYGRGGLTRAERDQRRTAA